MNPTQTTPRRRRSPLLVMLHQVSDPPGCFAPRACWVSPTAVSAITATDHGGGSYLWLRSDSEPLRLLESPNEAAAIMVTPVAAAA